MNIFDILGPVMVGPSSSHTAGAVRIGRTVRSFLGEKPVRAKIGLCGSFAATGRGHGTDRAIVAGLLGMKPDDMRIPGSFESAREEGLDFVIENIQIVDAHPNTALLEVHGEKGAVVEVQASSLGGGRIMVNTLDGIVVNCTGECPTLIVENKDRPGLVATITSMLSKDFINIATLQLYRGKKGGRAVMIIEIDHRVPAESVKWLEEQDGIINVTYIDKGDES